MAGLTGAFFDTSVLIAGSIDFGSSSQHALLLMDAVADGRTPLLRHGIRVLVSAELVDEIGR